MGNRLRLRSSSDHGAERPAGIARHIGIVARVVCPAGAQGQEMDEVLARRAWGVGRVCSCRVPDLAALRCTIRNAAASVVVVAASLSEGRARESTTCVETVRGTFAFAGAARNDSRGVADAIRVRRGYGCSEPCARCPGIHATLYACPLRRWALRCHAPATVARPDSRGFAGAIKLVAPCQGRAQRCSPLQTPVGTGMLQLRIAQSRKFIAYD